MQAMTILPLDNHMTRNKMLHVTMMNNVPKKSNNQNQNTNPNAPLVILLGTIVLIGYDVSLMP